jgi:glyoxylase-like metal-dependent hydrolase (beta-lactamase superfamily II)
MDNNTYIVVDPDSGEAALVDPSFDSRRIWPKIQEAGWKIRWVLNTHGHFDHVVENTYFVEATRAPLAIHEDDLSLLRSAPHQASLFGITIDPSCEPNYLLKPGQLVPLGGNSLRVVFTSGHSPGSVSFIGDGFVIAGDVLFRGSIGRTDLPGGSLKTLLESIRTELFILPDETIVYPGHGQETTIGHERTTNPYLQEQD